ncbi:DNA-binding transcriptional LysR family regulator [Kribbella sp. VKM Ac-2527]|uniref:DNA-binding transcriptional LysR family regulator n=1 Tax=Kribbella caucasensis TaxID=2512215 RepID=A0A4R6KIF1_9ACTN|nr:LysR family transcriptional regulator [Kribbella sp. VKM Ac-2527]TDO50699.1 DNA-binding transcriptional LysR family regulator [Kribbella sp. VKM Ac-2527]
MELRQLRYFVTVAEELHFGKAAERLNIVQPAVSQQVARLERELGLRLLDRSSRRVTLTGDGERMLREARAVLAAADRAAEVAAELVAGQAGVLRIGTSSGLRERLERGLSELRRTVPGIEIKLSSRPPGEQVEAVRSGELDVAFVRGPVTTAGVRGIPLWEEPLSVLLPSEYKAADGVKLVELAALPLRLPPRVEEPALSDRVLEACRDAGFEPLPGRAVDSLEDAIVEMTNGSPAWTVVYGNACEVSDGELWMGPFAPALSVPGQLVINTDHSPPCLDVLVNAFI